jgi:glutamate/tyrosine decarboxylase-like PLP-dependent enzyme
LYGSITTAGTRPAAPIAGAWATIKFLGADGYLRKAEQVRTATKGFLSAIAAIPELTVTGEPDMSVFEFTAVEGSGVDIAGVGDVMDDRGWNLDRQQGGLHLMVSPYHVNVVEQFHADLADAVSSHRASRGKAAGYGGIADLA